MNDRIKLAEAMGWKLKRKSHRGFGGQPIERRVWHNPEGITYRGIKLPDPFTDANDDYAVLEWMRENHRVEMRRAYNDLGTSYQWNYKIGNNARAALKVIDND